MRHIRGLILAVCGMAAGALVSMAPAQGQDCPGNPNALGTSRVLAVESGEYGGFGVMQYPETVPLRDKEVVLTFDDGPLPPYTSRVLDTLASECVKATFFMVGRQAQASPEGVRKVLDAGHTVATHSQTHPIHMHRLPLDRAKAEIDGGIASVTAALGDRSDALSPFFRIPGLARNDGIEDYARSKGLQIWSADFPADDWHHISSARVYDLAMRRLAAKGKGILLLHDIQPATALALPELLRELKTKGYRIVQVVPGKGEMPVPVAAKPAPIPAEAAPVDVAASAPTAVAVVNPMAALPANAADSFARGEDIAVDPARPFTSGSRPSRNMPTPDKFVTTEPGGWPPTISVPVPRAGGIGVSSRAGVSQTPDGRFQER
jgi:peptidoglycan/xylan/chitin deacetylase (PgdA/CDA1 family)